MSVTGIVIDDAVMDTFSKLKQKKIQHFFAKFNDKGDRVILDAGSVGERGTGYDEMIKAMPPKDPRYVICDYEYAKKGPKGEDEGKRDFLGSKLKTKMIFAGTKGAVKSKCAGIKIEIQATDVSEAAIENLLEKCEARA